MTRWFSEYERWLLTSPNGQHEHDAKNNHGSWFAAQTATYALYVGDTARARAIVEECKPRIGWQITPAGEQKLDEPRRFDAPLVAGLLAVAEELLKLIEHNHTD